MKLREKLRAMTDEELAQWMDENGMEFPESIESVFCNHRCPLRRNKDECPVDDSDFETDCPYLGAAGNLAMLQMEVE